MADQHSTRTPPRRIKLTAPAVSRLKPPAAGSVIYWDTVTTGFGLRISSGGRKSYIVQARALKEGRWINQKRKLGRADLLSLADAREAAKKELEAVQDGKQIGAAKREQRKRQTEASRNTYRSVISDFLQKYRTRQKRKPAPRTLEELRRVLNHDTFQDWRDRPITEITRRDILDAVDEFVTRGQETAANRYLTYLKMLFAWALDREIIQVDPTARVKPQGQENSRERVLDTVELRAIWQATRATQAGKGDLFACIVKVLMLTGQRRNEVAGMRWAEVDFGNRLWSIPGEIVENGKRIRRTKNGRDHLVPLSETVLIILRERQQEQAAMRLKTGLVFTSTGEHPFSGWSKSKTRLDGRAEKILREQTGAPAAKLKHWTLHDLRRSLVTRMAEDLHVQPHVVEAVVNHVSGTRAGVAGVYNRALYLSERRDALNAWGAYVQRLVGEAEPDNVVPIREVRQ